MFDRNLLCVDRDYLVHHSPPVPFFPWVAWATGSLGSTPRTRIRPSLCKMLVMSCLEVSTEGKINESKGWKKKRLIGVCWKILHPRFESRLLKVTHELWCCEFRSSKRNVDVMKNSIWNLQFGKNSVKQPNYQILDFRIFHKRLNCMFSQLYQRKMMSWFSCVVCFRKHLVTNIKCTFMSLCASSSDVHC